MATPAPFKLVDPSFTVGGVELKCSARQIRHTITFDQTDDSTFCRPSAQGVGQVTQTIELTVLQSFGADGLWNQLHPLRGTVVSFVLEATDGELDDDNPVMTGTCMVPPVPLVDAGVGENTELSLVFPIRTGGYTSISTGA